MSNSGSTSLIRTILFIVAACGASAGSGWSDELTSGRWRGGWSSQTTGHSGRLHARFRRIDSQHVRATFHGTFAKVVPFVYRPVLNIVHEEPGLVVLQGERRIPLGGTFTYEAVVTNGQFEATYRSRRDSGTWRMTRR